MLSRVERLIKNPDTCPNCWGMGWIPENDYKNPRPVRRRECHVCKGTGKSIVYMKEQLKKAGLKNFTYGEIIRD